MLYKDLTIYLHRHWSSAVWLEDLLDADAGGLQYTTGICVLLKPDEVDHLCGEKEFEVSFPQRISLFSYSLSAMRYI